MTITSADPNELDAFTSGAAYRRVMTASQAHAGRALANQVIANCGGRGVSLTNFPAVIELLDNMRANKAFVQGVADALRRADVDGGDGPVSIDDVEVKEALESGRYRTETAEITIDEAELLGEPPTSGMVDDPICAATGNFIHHDTDLVFPGTTASLNVHRSYNSLGVDRVGAFGPGWSSVFDVALIIDQFGDTVTAHLADGARERFGRQRCDGGEGEAEAEAGAGAAAGDAGGGAGADSETGVGVARWVSSGRRPLRLSRAADGWQLAVGADGARCWGFDMAGRVTEWRVNSSFVLVDRDDAGRISRLTEQRSGRSIKVVWAGERVVSLDAGPVGHTSYAYGDDGVLVRVESHAGWFDYESEGALLVRATDPDGVAQFVNVYDDAGRVVEQTSPFGRVTAYRYEVPGATVITDEAGVRQAMVHDGRGNLTAVIDADGSAMRMTYDDHDRVVRVVSKSGAVWRHDFDPVTGDLVRRVDPDGLTHTWAWDGTGRLTAETDRAGATTMYEYQRDGSGLTNPVTRDGVGLTDPVVYASPVRVVGADGTIASSELNEWGQPVAVTDADGVTVRFGYDRDGQIVSTIDALGHVTTFEFDAAGLLHRLVDPAGTTAELRYDGAGRVWQRTHADAVATYSHTPAGRICGGAEWDEGPWAATFGEHGALAEITDAIGGTTRYRYDTHGNVTSVVMADGAEFRQEFDSVGRLVAVVDPTGATSRTVYDREGYLASFTDATGRRVRRSVDAFGRTSMSTAPDDTVTTWTYHPGGEVATVTLADGMVWRTEVDVFGRIVAVVDPSGARATRTYSPGGRLVERTTPMGRSERYDYDAAGRLIESTEIDGTRQGLELDGRGRVLTATTTGVDGDVARIELMWDRAGHLAGFVRDGGVQRFDRDAAGRVLASIDPTGATTQYGYDLRGLMTDVVDPAGGRGSYTYDDCARMTSQTMPGERITTWTYNTAGFLDRMVDPAGLTTDWTRDASGAVTGTRRGDVGWTRTLDAGLRETQRSDLDGNPLGHYDYDTVGRMTNASVPGTDMLTEFLWDDAGQLAATTDPTGTSSIERDADGWATAFTDQTGTRTVIERDANGRITAVRDAIAPPLQRVHHPADNDNDNRNDNDNDGDDRTARITARDAIAPPPRLARSLDNGNDYVDQHDAAVGTEPTDTADADRDKAGRFDRAGRLLIGGNGTVYRYDDAGRLAERLPTAGSPTTFEYGTDGLLATERSGGSLRRFTHDRAGRVDSITIVGHGTTTITSDAAGRRSEERHPDGSSVAFEWNALDQLVGITRTDADGRSASVSIAIDALGRPARVTPVDGSSTDLGYNPLTNRPSTIGDTRMLDVGDTSWNSRDERWGTRAPWVANGIDIGGYTMLGARVFDPTTHQFLSPDPLFTVPGSNGSASAYTYAWQDPINYVDPTGMRPISIDEYQAIRQREEQGRVGQAWEAIKDDPLGTIAVVGLVAAATVIGGPVGTAVVLGMITTAGVGFATGRLSPRQVALSGVLAGAGVGLATSASSVGVGLAGSGALGFAGDVAGQALSGQPVDFRSAVVSGGINVATAGFGSRATSSTRAVVSGAVTDAASDVTYQVLTGDGHIDVNSVLVSTVSGATTSYAGHHLANGALSLDVTTSGTTTSTVDQLTTRTVVAQSHDITPSPTPPTLFSRGAPRTNADVLANGGALRLARSTVDHLAERGGVGLDGVDIQILTGVDDIRYLDSQSGAAFASDQTIYLGPAAFADDETLVRTLAHERTHVYQQEIWETGTDSLAALEDAAYGIEDTFWDHYVRGEP